MVSPAESPVLQPQTKGASSDLVQPDPLIQSNVLPQEIPVIPLPSSASLPDDATVPESSSPELEDFKSYQALLR